MDVIGKSAQALLTLLTIALLLIASAIGAVALIRITSADRKAVLMPALGGLLLGLALLANLTYWSRDQWVRARIRASQVDETRPVPPRPRAEIPPPKSTIQYNLPAWDQIPQAAAAIRAGAARSSGEDGAVLRAWVAHLEKLHAAHTNTFAASNKLHEVDLLDPKLISSFAKCPISRRTTGGIWTGRSPN